MREAELLGVILQSDLTAVVWAPAGHGPGSPGRTRPRTGRGLAADPADPRNDIVPESGTVEPLARLNTRLNDLRNGQRDFSIANIESVSPAD